MGFCGISPHLYISYRHIQYVCRISISYSKSISIWVEYNSRSSLHACNLLFVFIRVIIRVCFSVDKNKDIEDPKPSFKAMIIGISVSSIALLLLLAVLAVLCCKSRYFICLLLQNTSFLKNYLYGILGFYYWFATTALSKRINHT